MSFPSRSGDAIIDIMDPQAIISSISIGIIVGVSLCVLLIVWALLKDREK